MNIRFLQDYQGWITGPHFYRAGEVYDLPPQQAALLVDEGRAEYVRPEPQHAPVSDALTVAELIEIAKERGVPYSGLKKAELIEALNG